MKGIGGPLLCIGDLLNDVGESQNEQQSTFHDQSSISLFSPSTPNDSHSHHPIQPSDLSKLFQENYDQLNKALAGTDHSWTSLTLKLCTTLDTAKKLIESTDTNATLLSEKIVELEKMVKKRDSAIKDVRSIHSSLSQLIAASSTDSQA